MKRNKKTAPLLIGVCALFLGFSYVWDQHFDSKAVPASSSVDSTSEDGMQTEFPPDKQVTAPDFSLQDVKTGATMHLASAVRQRPVVFSFWATWCGPCNMELPVLNSLSKKYSGKIDFYGINSNDDPDTIRKFAVAKNLTFPMLGDTSQDASNAYQAQEIPLLVVVGTDGKIKFRMDGFSPDEDVFLPTILDQVLAENHTGFFSELEGLFSRKS